MNAKAKIITDLPGNDDVDLSGHDFVRFHFGKWRKIDIREGDGGLIVNSDIGEPLTIEMSSSNHFVIKVRGDDSNAR